MQLRKLYLGEGWDELDLYFFFLSLKISGPLNKDVCVGGEHTV